MPDKPRTWCPQCGPGVSVTRPIEDLDVHTCTTCGIVATGPGADAALEALERVRGLEAAHPLDAWHDDIGDVLWWTFPVKESPYCGSPLYSDWPGYHTHWTLLSIPQTPEETADD